MNIIRINLSHNMNTRVHAAISALASLLIATTVLIVVFSVDGIAPFGKASNTLASMDANVQYNDLFSYYQALFKGEASPLYSFEKGLGGSAIAVFSYYLTSPFNLLFLLVPNNAVQIMFNIVVLLKLSTAAATSSLFFSSRFPNLNRSISVALSVSYALMQYSIAQSSNIMWLDGVYMLPLMAMATSNLIKSGNGIASLALFTGLSILFNWYSGAINCLFLIIWFFFELGWNWSLVPSSSIFSYVFGRGIKFAGAMLLGILLSLVLFLPTALSLVGGRASAGHFSEFLWAAFNGNPLNAILGSAVGSISSPNRVSLFCGAFVLLGCITLPFENSIPPKRRIALIALAMVLVLLCYWQPLFTIFSLFTSATSFWFRYSYVSIFGLCAIAATYYEFASNHSLKRRNGKTASPLLKTIPTSFAFCVILIVTSEFKDASTPYALLITTVCTIGVAAMLSASDHRTSLNKSPRGRVYSSCSLLAILILMVELAVNTHLLIQNYSVETVSSRSNYVTNQDNQIESIKSSDQDAYRITQDSTYNMLPGSLTANYNEGLAYGYPTIATYTSDPVDSQRKLLNALGYPICGDNMNIVNTSILAADSLLGVRYALLSEEINGYEEYTLAKDANGKSVYRNPYALPLAFLADSLALSELQTNAANPFEYQNSIYSALLGEKTELYNPVAYTSSTEVRNGRSTTTFTFDSQGLRNEALYGIINVDGSQGPSTVTIGNRSQGYSQWLAPSVFYIPNGTDHITIEFDYTSSSEENLSASFYALDLDSLERATDTLRSGAASEITLNESSAIISVYNTEGGKELFTTIPYDEGWSVSVNGTSVQPSNSLGCFMSIPLQSGANTIELTYIPRGFVIGAIISSMTAIFLLGLALRNLHSKYFHNNRV